MANPLQSSVMLNRDWIHVNSRGPHNAVAPDCVQNSSNIGTETGPQYSKLRRHVRVASNIRALLDSKHRFQSVVIRNISRGGAGLDNCDHLIENDKVAITLLNGRRIEAKVRWWLAGVCGVQFSELLEPTDVLLTGRARHPEQSRKLSIKSILNK